MRPRIVDDSGARIIGIRPCALEKAGIDERLSRGGKACIEIGDQDAAERRVCCQKIGDGP